MNPIFSSMPMPMQPQNNLMQRIQQFAQTVNGNPQQIVQNLMRSGQMSQQQFQQYSQMANRLLGRQGQ